MKLSKLVRIVPGIIAMFGAVVMLPSCNDNDGSENVSTIEPDSVTIRDNTTMTTPDNTVVPMDTAVTTTSPSTPGSTSMNTATTNTARKGRSGRVTVATTTENRSSAMKADNMGYYNYAETSPSYNGGQNAISNYINNNIEYPQDAIDNGAEGTVYVRFGVDENGNITNVKTTGSKIGYGLEEEAIRAVKNMSKWNPGQLKGKPVKVWVDLPITFRIEG
jgi:protein TonB